MVDFGERLKQTENTDGLPWSEDAEQAVLSAALIDPDAARKAVELLKPEDFYLPRHALIHKALVQLVDAKSIVDPLTLSDALQGNGSLDRAGGKEYVGFLVDAVPTAANVEYHAQIVRQKSQARVLLVALQAEVRKLQKTNESPSDIAARIAQLTLAVQTPGQGGFVSASDIMAELAPALLEREASGGMVGLPTGFAEFDNATGGIRDGEVMFIGGVPGSGKTALGLQIALYNAVEREQVVPIGFVSAEMTRLALMERAVSNIGRIHTGRLRRMRLLDDETQRIGKAFAVLKHAPMHIDDTPLPSLQAAAARCRALKAKEPALKLIVVDFVQLLMNDARGDDDGTRAEELRIISYGLKGLAKELGLAIIVLAQLNDKTVENRADKRPTLADLQGSSGMRQAADFILLCYRPKMYDDTEPADMVQVNVAKAREVSTLTMELLAQLQYMRITDKPSYPNGATNNQWP